MKITTEEFEFMRRRLRNMMPKTMKAFEVECRTAARPDAENLSKRDYINRWVTLFDENFLGQDFSEFENYSMLNLKKAFDWTMDNFAELDLGGDCAWYSASFKVLKYLARKAWNENTETKIFYKFMIETRWAVECGA